MSIQCDGDYDRERLALYLTGLLPLDPIEGPKVLDLCGRLLPPLIESKKDHPPEDHREREADSG